MSEKLEKLVELGKKTLHKTHTDYEELQNFVEEQMAVSDVIHIVSGLKWKLDGPEVLEYIFFGLTQIPQSQKKRYKAIEATIVSVQDQEISNKVMTHVTSTVCHQLDRLSIIYLMKVSNICVECIRTAKTSIGCSWKEIFPKVLNLLVDTKKVNHCGTEMTGLEYKSEIIRSLCMIDWNPNIMTALASMFIETQLNREEHEQVVKKLCNSFDELEPQELPPLVHQLLQLCKEEHAVIVFLNLRNYFNKRLYCRSLEGDEKDIESITEEDVVEAESTILCHIEEFARISRMNDLIKLCKNSLHSPDLLLDPFLLSVLLTLSCISAYEVQVMDLLRNMLTHIVTEETKIKQSAWLRSIINSHIGIERLFNRLIHSRIGEHDKVMKGLISLCFLLLSVSGTKGKENITKKLWNTGRVVLVSLVKKHRKVTKSVLHTLTDRIITGLTSHQYTEYVSNRGLEKIMQSIRDCLLHLCSVSTMSMLDNLPLIFRILEFVHQLPGSVSHRIVTAIIPLVRISPKLRDNLILNLRKALFSREIETRQTAVIGFLQLLRFLKLQGFSALSQNSLCLSTLSGPSVFTQICLEVHSQQQGKSSQQTANTNITICLEVLGILKRCFSQQTSVKLSLYKGLYNAVSANIELSASVLDILLDHFGQFYISDESALPPLQFEKIAVIQGAEIVSKEPLGHLVLLIQDIVVKSSDVINNEDAPVRSFTMLTEILNSLVIRFSKCDLIHFQLNEETDLTDIVPESLLTQQIIKEVLSVYEALMAYIINSWNCDSTVSFVTKFISLHKGYSSVTDFIKENNKSGKKKGDENAAPRGKRKQKTEQGVILPKKTPFKVPSTIFGFNTIYRILSLFLQDEVEWSSRAAHNEIKHRRPIFKHATHILLDSINQTKIRLNEEQKSSTVFKEASLLAKLLYERCLCRFDEVATFEPYAAVSCLEGFTELCVLINTYYNSQFSQFLQDAVFVAIEDGIVGQLMPVLEIYKALLTKSFDAEKEDTDKDEEDDDVSPKHLTSVLLNALTTFVTILPSGDEGTAKILDWLVLVAGKHVFTNVNNAKMFVNLLLSIVTRCKIDLTLLDSMSIQLGNLFPSINDVEKERTLHPLLVILDGNKMHVLPLLCSTLISNLDDADWIITRFKSEHHIVPYIITVNEEQNTKRNSIEILQRKERELCQRLIHITLMTQSICSIAVPTGPCMEYVFKLVTRNYSVLCSLTKYFILRSDPNNLSYQRALFNKLVKVGGNGLSSQVAELIIFVEAYEIEKKVPGKLANSQARKQAILIPKLVSELENFTKFVTVLSKKCKDTKLSNNLKLTTTRDFRLNIKKLEEVMSKQNETETEDDVNDAEPSVVESERNNDNIQPPRKKQRKN